MDVITAEVKDAHADVCEQSCLVTEEVVNEAPIKVADVTVHSVDSFNEEMSESGTEQVPIQVPVKEDKIAESVCEDVLPEEVTIQARPGFGNCPYDRLAQNDLDSLSRFICSKDHLRKNISRIQFESVSFGGVNENGTFEHSVQVRMSVLRRNLWQGAGAYI